MSSTNPSEAFYIEDDPAWREPEPVVVLPELAAPSAGNSLSGNREQEQAQIDEGVEAAKEYVVDHSEGIRQVPEGQVRVAEKGFLEAQSARWDRNDLASTLDYLEIAEGVGDTPGADPYATQDRLQHDAFMQDVAIRREVGKIIKRRQIYAAEHPVLAVLRGWGKYRAYRPGGDEFVQREIDRFTAQEKAERARD
jgi:hypothetical protein